MSAKSDNTPTLVAQSRALTGRKVKQVRRDGKIPAVVYGHKQDTQVLSVDQKTFEKLYHEAGSTTLINLSIDDKTPVKVLIHDIQVDPLRRAITHADFYQVNLKEKLQTEVPLSFVGTAPAVEIEGGIFLAVRSDVEIECLPDDLIQEIEVDITSLKSFEDQILVKDLKIPSTITVLTDSEEVVASVSEPISEEELAKLDEAPEATVETEFETAEGTAEAPAEGEEGAASEAEKKDEE